MVYFIPLDYEDGSLFQNQICSPTEPSKELLYCCKWKEKKAVSRERNAAATGEEEGASSRQDAQMQLFERLRMLKQLCDEGVLTEQEFEEMKAKLLGSGE